MVVAGAAGFIGARLVRALVEWGCEVHALVRPGGSTARLAGLECQVTEADAEDGETVRGQLTRARPHAVINAVRAPRSGKATGASGLAGLITTNVAAATNLMLGAHAAGCRRFLQLGSSTEYAPGSGPIAEDRALRPVTTHGATKAAASLICRSLAEELRVGFTLVRPFQVYGPGDHSEHLIPRAIRASVLDHPLPLAPEGRRDWIYVDDVAEACLRALALDRAGLEINVGSGRQWTNAQVVERVGLATGCSVSVRIDASAGRDWDRSDWVADTGRARATLGWEPRHDLDAGLARTVAWARTQAGAPVEAGKP